MRKKSTLRITRRTLLKSIIAISTLLTSVYAISLSKELWNSMVEPFRRRLAFDPAKVPPFARLVPLRLSPSYIIYIEATTIKALNCQTGEVEFVGIDAKAVTQSAINAIDEGIIFFKPPITPVDVKITELTHKPKVTLLFCWEGLLSFYKPEPIGLNFGTGTKERPQAQIRFKVEEDATLRTILVFQPIAPGFSPMLHLRPKGTKVIEAGKAFSGIELLPEDEVTDVQLVYLGWKAGTPDLPYLEYGRMTTIPSLMPFIIRMNDAGTFYEIMRLTETVPPNIQISRDIIPATTAERVIGSSTLAMLRVWTRLISSDTAYIGHEKNLRMEGDLIYIPKTDATGSIGTDTNRFALVRAVTITAGELGFEEKSCFVCGKAFKEGEGIGLGVSKVGKTIKTKPAHLRCLK